MITLKRICDNEDLFDWAMNLLEISFPSCERRDNDFQRYILNHSDYRFCAILDEGNPVGVAGYFETEKFIYLENFCILPEKRNQGYGSQTLSILTSQGKTFILEIEPPVDELTKRRLGFYKRNGMVENPYPHIQARYHENDDELRLVILSFASPISNDEYNAFKNYLDLNVDIKSWKRD